LQKKEDLKMYPITQNRGTVAGLSLSAVALSAIALLAPNAFSEPDPNFHIYLAFGQSNMEGNATPEAIDKTGISDRFKMMAAVDWPDKSRTKGTWSAAVPPTCRNGTGLNPGDYFGRTLVDSLPANIKVGIINVAVAGCAIEMFDEAKYKTYVAAQADWMKTIADGYGGDPYARLVEVAKLAQKDGVIKGIIFHQGESGSSTNQWAAEVKLVHDNLIRDLGLDAAKIPFIAGDLVSQSKMIQDLPKTLPNSYVVSSAGLEQRGDGLHFSAKGYREFGKRYASTMLGILAKGTALASKPSSEGYALAQAGRNPANGNTRVTFEIPRRASVSVTAYSLRGARIAGLADGEFAAGKHTLEFGRNTLPTGLCVLEMRSGAFSATRTVLIEAK
jgi:hypothetical protein